MRGGGERGDENERQGRCDRKRKGEVKKPTFMRVQNVEDKQGGSETTLTPWEENGVRSVT